MSSRPVIASIVLAAATAVFLSQCVGCGAAESAPPQEKDWRSLVDGERAMALLEQFAAIGGFSHSRAHESNLDEARALIKKKLAEAGLSELAAAKPWRQVIPDPKGTAPRRVTMENIVGVIPGERPEVIAIGCHYDTKIFDDFPFVGANDGCSGVALNLELARHLVERARKKKPPFTIWLVFFDGEEAIHNWGANTNGVPDNCYGSRRMAQHREEFPIETLILLDMVGDRDLLLNYEARSNPELRRMFHEKSKEFFGVDLFGTTKEILDDHIPFIEQGMDRVIDLIDYEYGPANSWWHTEEDTPDKCSARSLDRVGSLVLHALPTVEAWLAGKLGDHK